MRHLRWGDISVLNYGKGLRNYAKEKSEENSYPVYGTNGQIGWYKDPLHNEPGIIVGRKGAYREVHYSPQPFYVIDTAYYLKLTSPDVHLKWAYYYLSNVDINRLDSGAAIPSTKREDFYSILAPLPTLNEQQKIADVLSSYDTLIENNRRRIALLEESARLLYQEWFVRLRFPGFEDVRVVGGVPEGWEKKTFVDIANITMGQSPESKFYNENGEGLPFHQGVSDFGDRYITHRIYCTQLNRIAEADDILLSVRAPVGRLNITPEKIVIGRGLAGVRSKFDAQSMLYYQLKAHFFKEDMIGGGAIFAAVTKKDLENQKLLCPSQNLIEQFQNTSRPIDSQIKVLTQQNQKLQQARDLLLPRLMRGEIPV